jgi:L-2-hydroxyglutarate oxidase LhgO
LEPLLNAHLALLSPETGIIDSHSFMQHLETSITDKDGIVAYKSRVVGIERVADEYRVLIQSDKEQYYVQTPILVNAAGFGAAEVAQMIYPDMSERIHVCKGHYFSLRKRLNIKHLVYPVPEKNIAGLGIHLTLDLAGKIKFGPDVEYIKNINYSFTGDKARFLKAVKSYLPCVQENDLVPDYVGLRPKLQGPGCPIHDFSIRRRDGFVSLVGIESPGLTSSLAIAEHVDGMLY